jgi:DNA replication protein DnaC
MEKLEKSLKKIAESTKRAGLDKAIKSSPENPIAGNSMGDPNCPICHGIGFVSFDVEPSDPRFGRMEICPCRHKDVLEANRKRLYLLSNLEALSRLTFATFEPRGRVGLGKQQGDSLEQAYNHAQNFAGSLNGWLLLMGKYGCGKTHLAAAIANQAVALGVPTLFLTVPDLLDWLRFAYSDQNDNAFEERFDEIRNVALLVMDDFGMQNATAWAQEKLFQIINYRYINRLATVITSNNQLADFDGRIKSRLTDPELVTQVNILAPDYRNPKDDTGHHELSSLGLHGKKTFGNFSMRKDESIPAEDVRSLSSAFDIAKSYAEKPEGWLVFNGPYGCGKTHLAAAIGNYQTGLGNPPMMVVVPDLLDHLRATFSPNSNVSLDKRFEEIKSARMLILDDLGTQSATPWAKEKLYQIFNHRYNAELPTVITTSSLAEELDPRLYSRMLDARICKIVLMSAPPFRGGGKVKKY